MRPSSIQLGPARYFSLPCYLVVASTKKRTPRVRQLSTSNEEFLIITKLPFLINYEHESSEAHLHTRARYRWHLRRTGDIKNRTRACSVRCTNRFFITSSAATSNIWNFVKYISFFPLNVVTHSSCTASAVTWTFNNLYCYFTKRTMNTKNSFRKCSPHTGTRLTVFLSKILCKLSSGHEFRWHCHCIDKEVSNINLDKY